MLLTHLTLHWTSFPLLVSQQAFIWSIAFMYFLYLSFVGIINCTAMEGTVGREWAELKSSICNCHWRMMDWWTGFTDGRSMASTIWTIYDYEHSWLSQQIRLKIPQQNTLTAHESGCWCLMKLHEECRTGDRAFPWRTALMDNSGSCSSMHNCVVSCHLGVHDTVCICLEYSTWHQSLSHSLWQCAVTFVSRVNEVMLELSSRLMCNLQPTAYWALVSFRESARDPPDLSVARVSGWGMDTNSYDTIQYSRLN